MVSRKRSWLRRFVNHLKFAIGVAWEMLIWCPTILLEMYMIFIALRDMVFFFWHSFWNTFPFFGFEVEYLDCISGLSFSNHSSHQEAQGTYPSNNFLTNSVVFSLCMSCQACGFLFAANSTNLCVFFSWLTFYFYYYFVIIITSNLIPTWRVLTATDMHYAFVMHSIIFLCIELKSTKPDVLTYLFGKTSLCMSIHPVILIKSQLLEVKSFAGTL